MKGNIIFHKFSITFHVIEQRPYPSLRGYNAIVLRKKKYRKKKKEEGKKQVKQDTSCLSAQYSGLLGDMQVMMHHHASSKESSYPWQDFSIPIYKAHIPPLEHQDNSDQALLDKLAAAREDWEAPWSSTTSVRVRYTVFWKARGSLSTCSGGRRKRQFYSLLLIIPLSTAIKRQLTSGPAEALLGNRTQHL